MPALGARMRRNLRALARDTLEVAICNEEARQETPRRPQAGAPGRRSARRVGGTVAPACIRHDGSLADPLIGLAGLSLAPHALQPARPPAARPTPAPKTDHTAGLGRRRRRALSAEAPAPPGQQLSRSLCVPEKLAHRGLGGRRGFPEHTPHARTAKAATPGKGCVPGATHGSRSKAHGRRERRPQRTPNKWPASDAQHQLDVDLSKR